MYMNINKIFNLFKADEEYADSSTQIDLSHSPAIWIGMFKKLIVNYEVFAKQLIQFFGTSEPSLDMDQIEKASSHMVYEKAFDSISKLDLTNQTHIDCLKIYADDTFKKTLNSALDYYLKLEEYEKCAFLKQIQDIVTLS